MAFEAKPGGFSLFRNERKKESTHPDFDLKITFDQDLIDNLQEQLDEGKTPTLYGGGWVKQRDGASPFISGTAKPPYQRQEATPEVVDSMLEKTPESTDTRTTEEIMEAGIDEPEQVQAEEVTDDLPF